jgi:hypothetical protein
VVCKYTLRHVYILGQGLSEQLSDLQCVNASGLTVAWYAVSSSGCMFGVEEPYPHLVVGKTLLCYKAVKDRVN